LVEHFVSTAKELKKTFGLTLFGFDVILPVGDDESSSSAFIGRAGKTVRSGGKKLMIIDVNYFPSYKEVKDFPERLKNYLKKIAFS
jgi:glutathione synthase/RimK-type ligase-like ATP-grasp enzyme